MESELIPCEGLGSSLLVPPPPKFAPAGEAASTASSTAIGILPAFIEPPQDGAPFALASTRGGPASGPPDTRRIAPVRFPRALGRHRSYVRAYCLSNLLPARPRS